MENRSFDHMLGWMKRLNPEIDGVTSTEWNPANTTDPAAGHVYFGEGAQYVDPDPGHSFQEIRQQIFGSDAASGPARMDGFVQQARSLGGNMTDAVMHGFAPDSVAVYRELVAQFAVCDRWFASVPSSTQPNRLFVHSGTSGGATSNNPQYVLHSFIHSLIIIISIDCLCFTSFIPHILHSLLDKSIYLCPWIFNFCAGCIA